MERACRCHDPRWHLGALAACLLGSAWLALWIGRSTEPPAVDRDVLFALRARAEPALHFDTGWFVARVRDFSALGAGTTLVVVSVVVIGASWLKGRRREALHMTWIVCGGLLASEALKSGFARPRPVLVPGGIPPSLDSFPSGHAMMSIVAYSAYAALWSRLDRSRVVRRFAIGLTFVLIVGIGATRLYLCVHWLTDVLAGWLFGASWLLLCAWVIRFRARPWRP